MAEDQVPKKEEGSPVFDFISKGIKSLVEAVMLLIIKCWK
jgi:hypothetical protein